MKKIITLICLVGVMQNGFAKWIFYNSYTNYTQNITASSYQSNYNFNVIANYGDSVVFCDFIENVGNGIPIYPSHWYLNGDSIPGEGGHECINLIINQPGIYSASTGWTINFYVLNATGIPSLKNINSLNVFPTIVTSSITIQLNSIKTNDIEISFFDVNGRQLKNNFYKKVFGEFIKNENTEALAKGIYFLRIKTGEDLAEKKFVKM